MNEPLSSLFAESRDPTHCCRSRIHAQVRPVGQVVAAMQRQIAEYRALLLDVELRDDLHDVLRGKTETIEQTLRAAERIQGELLAAIRNASQIMGQVTRVFEEAERDIATWEDGRARDAQLALPSSTS